MEGVSPRQQLIMTLARQMGSVTVDDLALRFDVTPQTIRKDLNELVRRAACWRAPMAAPCSPPASRTSPMRRAG